MKSSNGFLLVSVCMNLAWVRSVYESLRSSSFYIGSKASESCSMVNQ